MLRSLTIPMVSTPLKPMGKKRALLIGIRSVVGSEFGGLPYLEFAHRDAKALNDYLINTCGFLQDDTILMLDSKHHPKNLRPTRRNILQQIARLTHDAPEDCHIIIYFSGHGDEQECESGQACMRADGRKKKIICADGKAILDDELHSRLVAPLEKIKGSNLFALLDCCHSESLLGLQKGKKSNSYSRKWKMGRDQLFQGLSISIAKSLQVFKRNRRHDDPPAPNRKPSRKSTILSIGGELTSESESPAKEELSVICLSACRDWQLTSDDRERGLTFTKCFLDAMAQNPSMTWAELRDVLKERVWDIRSGNESVVSKQDPKFSTSSHVNLTQEVAATLGDGSTHTHLAEITPTISSVS